jgi:hypothetical protein
VTTVLATTLHDPVGRVRPGIERAGAALRELFAGAVVNATHSTVPEVLRSLELHLGADIVIHQQSEAVIGTARRDAVARSLIVSTATHVLYSDLCHVLRWIEARPDELAAAISADHPEDFLVIGRSASAFARSPQRLRDTEAIVNHIFGLVSGHHGWDTMFAIRRMSRCAAEAVVDHCTETTMANDVEWPLVAQAQGFRLGYLAADGLSYRTIYDFDAPTDDHDGDPIAWIRRVEFAAQHASATRRFIDDGPQPPSRWS